MLSGEECMPQYRIAWLPGDGVGREVMDATRLVLDAVQLDADYRPGDIGWEFWRREGDAFPARTIDLLKRVDAALFGAVTSKPKWPVLHVGTSTWPVRSMARCRA